MTDTWPRAHVLILDIVGRASADLDYRNYSLVALTELITSCNACKDAASADRRLVFPIGDGLAVVFLENESAPVQCALEVYEDLQELPSLPVRMGIHSGPIVITEGPDGQRFATGEGIDFARELIETVGRGDILMSESYAQHMRQAGEWSSRIQEDGAGGKTDAASSAVSKRYRIEPQKLFILQGDDPASGKAALNLKDALTHDGHHVATDLPGSFNLEWARSIELKVRSADTVVVFLTPSNVESELLLYQLELAVDERRVRGRPQILPIWQGTGLIPDSPVADIISRLERGEREADSDPREVISDVRAALATGITDFEPERISSTGGAVAGNSKFYIERSADKEFADAIKGTESIILVKGPRQIGKTSLIGRGIEWVQEFGWRYVSTDFQKLGIRQLEEEALFYRVVATTLSRELGFEYDFDNEWLDALGSNLNMDGFIRALVASANQPLVWFIDEADRLFSSPFASDFFGLVRSWHNARATDRRGPWSRLTIVVGYATEAHLFIKDLNQSPFNVGRAIPLPSFSMANLSDLNERYGRPLDSHKDLVSLFTLLGGQPFLTRRAFEVLTRDGMSFQTLLTTADSKEGPFGDHLKRVLVSATHLPFVWDALEKSLMNPEMPDSEGLQRLIAAGVLIHRSDRGFELPCELYRRFLSHFIGGNAGL